MLLLCKILELNMPMTKQIIWSPLSESDLDCLLSYLQTHWSNNVALDFLDKIDLLITQLSLNPKQFPLINKKRKIRKCVITKHNILFYRETKKSIEIIRLFDTRQSPTKKYKK